MELVAFDLDGTLLNSQQRLSDYTIETLERLKAAGVYYTIATGRTHMAAAPCIQGHDFSNVQIFKNGVEWWDPQQGQYRHRHLLCVDQISAILSYFEQHQVTPFVYSIDDNNVYQVYHAPVQGSLSDHLVNELGSRKNMQLRPISELTKEVRITNISAMGQPDAINNILLASAKHDHLIGYSGGGIYNQDAYWIDIHHSHVCKGSSLMELKAEIGAERLIVFGDSDNDLSMFHQADECFATDNALSVIKAAATDVIGHHDEDGVARYLRLRYKL